jgi:hypothetical protein
MYATGLVCRENFVGDEVYRIVIKVENHCFDHLIPIRRNDKSHEDAIKIV